MSLAVHLRRHRERLDELTLLEQERAHLAAGPVDGAELGRLAERKQACLTALNEFEQRRREVQRRLGYRDDHEGDRRAAAALCTRGPGSVSGMSASRCGTRSRDP